MPELSTPSATLYYEIWGDGNPQRPWVTLLNGYTRTLRDYRTMGTFLADQGWRVLALDNRGAGRSRSQGDFSVEDLANDVSALWKAVGCSASHLLGISLGGMIAMRLAVRRPAALKSLVLVSTTARWTDRTDIDLLDAPDDETLRARVEQFFSPGFATRQKILLESLARELAKAFQSGPTRAGAIAQRQAFRGYEIAADLSAIAVPTLVLHGGADRVVPVENARAIASRISGAELEIFEGVGHLLLAEAAPQLYRSAAGFFSRVEGRGRTGD